jgi:hypothetical protein
VYPWAEDGRGGGERISFATPIGQDSVHFAVGLTFDEVLAAVPMGFSSAQTDQNLKASVF